MRIGEFRHDQAELTIYAARQRGQLSVYIEDECGDRVADLSMYVPHLRLGRDEFVLNATLSREPRLVRDAFRTGYFEETGRVYGNGGATGQPIWRLAGVIARFPLADLGRYAAAEHRITSQG